MNTINSQVMASSTSKASKFSYAVNNRTALFKLVDNFGAARYFDSHDDAEACRAALTEMREGFKATLYFKSGRSWELWEIPAENIVEIPAPVQVNDYAGTINLTETPETADYVCYVDGEEFIVPSNVVSTITSLAKEKVAGWDDKVAMGYVYYDDYKVVVYRDTLAIKKNNDSQFGKLISFSVTPCEADSADSETPEAKIALSDDIYADTAQRMADAYACCEMSSFWMDDDSDFMDNKIAEALGTDVTYVWEHIDINYDRLWSMAYDKWVEDRKKTIKAYIDDDLANDPTFAEHLAILNEEQGDSFDLVYEVGNYIYYGLTDSTGEPVYDDSEVADVVSLYDWSMDADGVYWSEKEPVLEAYGEPVVVESNDDVNKTKMAC